MKSELLIPIVNFGRDQTLRYHFLLSAEGKCYGNEDNSICELHLSAEDRIFSCLRRHAKFAFIQV